MQYLILVVVFLYSSMAFPNEDGSITPVRVCQVEKAKYLFRIDLANLILAKTAPVYGDARVTPFRKETSTVSQDRCVVLLKQQQVDLLYLPPKDNLLESFDYIPFDIHAGMLGYRVFIIRENDQRRFDQVESLDDLRRFVGGFGSQWGDFKVFGLNDLPVIGAANTSVLLNMLNHERFDYFHRGLHEAWAEVEANNSKLPNLSVETGLTLRYPFQVYYWFNPSNTELKQRFETGLLLVLQDGSYHALFKEYFQKTVKRARLAERKTINIKYPLPQKSDNWVTEVNHTPFWVEPRWLD
ncbi:hypothetical protein [Litoribacillus peritrichatus]|uniref:Transporter substrate-binding domain-containing protein n=1 Tax=Litoribacillus peritrichatus TaxID=718191 RepID=A0ABP7N2B1_9GAMM